MPSALGSTAQLSLSTAVSVSVAVQGDRGLCVPQGPRIMTDLTMSSASLFSRVVWASYKINLHRTLGEIPPGVTKWLVKINGLGTLSSIGSLRKQQTGEKDTNRGNNRINGPTRDGLVHETAGCLSLQRWHRVETRTRVSPVCQR